MYPLFWTKKNIGKVEAVQRRAARFVTKKYNVTSSVTTLIGRLEWESLRQRHSLVAKELPPKFNQTGAVTGEHQKRYMIPFCRTVVFKKIFFPCIRHQDIEPAA